MVAEVVEIRAEDLDGSIKRKILSIADVTVNMHARGGILRDEEFAKLMSDYAIEDIRQEVADYYSFMGDVEVKIAPEDVRGICRSVEV